MDYRRMRYGVNGLGERTFDQPHGKLHTALRKHLRNR